MKDSFPWEGNCGRIFNQRAEKIQNIKANIPTEELCECLFSEFSVFLKCLQSVNFFQKLHFVEYIHMFGDYSERYN